MKPNHVRTNVHEVERAASILGGGLLFVPLMRRATWSNAALALAGVGFIARGLTGHSEFYHALGINTERHAHRQSAEFTHTLTVAKPVSETFAAWLSYERFPRFMKYVDEVNLHGRRESHWKVHTPMGTTIEWEAVSRVNNANRSVAWKTISSAVIQHSGNIKFVEGEVPDTTDITVYCHYHPLGGRLTAMFIALLKVSPEDLIKDDLKRFKQSLEDTKPDYIGGTGAGTGVMSNIPLSTR